MSKSKKQTEETEVAEATETTTKVSMSDKLKQLEATRRLGKDIGPSAKKLVTIKRCLESLKTKDVMEYFIPELDNFNTFVDEQLVRLEELIP